jgi:hypothetical protein
VAFRRAENQRGISRDCLWEMSDGATEALLFVTAKIRYMEGSRNQTYHSEGFLFRPSPRYNYSSALFSCVVISVA